MNKKAKILVLGLVGLILLMGILSLYFVFADTPSISDKSEVVYKDYKYSNNSGVILSAPSVAWCSYKPDSTNDGYKTCEMIVEGINHPKYALTVDVLKFILDKSNRVKGGKYEFYFSNKYENYTDYVYNETCLSDVSKKLSECKINVQRKRFLNWVKLTDLKTTYSDVDFAYKVVFEIPQYESAHYNFSISYKKIDSTEILTNLDPDVSACGILNTENATYTLNQSITNTSITGSCLIISANNITLNLNGSTLSGDMGSGEAGILDDGYANLTIKNGIIKEFAIGININADYINISNMTISARCTTFGASTHGILLNSSNSFLDSIYVYNLTCTGTCSNAGISVENGNSNRLQDINISDLRGYGSSALVLASTTGNILNRVSISNYTTGLGYGVEIDYSANNNFSEVNISGGHSISNFNIYTQSSMNNTFLNSSYNSSKESISADSSLIRKWYYKAFVNDTEGNLMNAINITSYNVSGIYQFNLTTDATGYTGLAEITDYINNGTRTYYSLYNIYASNSSYLTSNHSYNATLQQSNYKDVFSLFNSSVRSCSNLTESGVTYIQMADITATTYPCINITAENITFNGNGFWITNSSDIGGSGIYSEMYNTTIKNANISIKSGEGHGISLNYPYNSPGAIHYFQLSNVITSYNRREGIEISVASTNPCAKNNITLSGITANNNGQSGISIIGYFSVSCAKILLSNITTNYNVEGIRTIYTSGMNISNLTSKFNSQDGVEIDFGDSISIDNSQIIGNGISGVDISGTVLSSANRLYLANLNFSGNYRGLYFYTSKNGIVVDTTFFNNSYDLSLAGSSSNNTLLNSSYNISRESVVSTSSLTRKWYFDAEVHDFINSSIENANVSGFNLSDNNVFSALTAATGKIARQEVTEYINTNGVRAYQTPHTINTTKTGFKINSTTFNLTQTQNVFHNVTLYTNLQLNITLPILSSYNYNESINLNYTLTNYTSISRCWFYIFNSSNGYEKTNTTITNCQNTTFNISKSGIYSLHLWANDTNNEQTNDSVVFQINLEFPSVNLNYPNDNDFLNYTQNVYFNFTAIDSNGLDTCELFSNWTGTWHKNYTWYLPTNATMNWTVINLSDGKFKWIVGCNDSTNNYAFAIANRTITFDTLSPSLNITDPKIGGVYTDDDPITAIALKYIVNDTNLDSCWYNLISDDGGNNISTTAITGCANSSFSLDVPSSGAGTYEYSLTLCADDIVNHTTCKYLNFFTLYSSGATGGGGGGSAEPILYHTIGLIHPVNINKTYSDLEKSIIFAVFNSFCEKKVSKSLFVINYYQQCTLSLGELEDVRKKLIEYSVLIPQDEIILWYEQYKQDRIYQTYMKKSDIDTYNLLMAVVENPLIISPASLDKIFLFTSNTKRLEYSFKASKKIAECSVVSNTPAMWCEIVSELSFKAYYNLTSSENGVYSGQIAVTSLDGEVRYVNTIWRTYNLASIILTIGLIIMGIFLVSWISYRFFRKRGK